MLKAEDIIKNVAKLDTSSNSKIEENVQLVVFELDREEYAVEITELQEIIRFPEITPIPNSPSFIRGIFNLRGKIIVVIDLEKRFNLLREFETKEANIIITELNENGFGVIVDRVTEIINVPTSSIQPTPALISTKIHADYLKGIVVAVDHAKKEQEAAEDSNRLIILLDLPKMLQEKELLNLGKTIQQTTKETSNTN